MEISEARIHGIDPIPRLSELLAEFPDARFNIDAKSPAAVALLAEAIAEFDAYDRVCVCSFGIRRLYELVDGSGGGCPPRPARWESRRTDSYRG